MCLLFNPYSQKCHWDCHISSDVMIDLILTVLNLQLVMRHSPLHVTFSVYPLFMKYKLWQFPVPKLPSYSARNALWT